MGSERDKTHICGQVKRDLGCHPGSGLRLPCQMILRRRVGSTCHREKQDLHGSLEHFAQEQQALELLPSWEGATKDESRRLDRDLNKSGVTKEIDRTIQQGKRVFGSHRHFRGPLGSAQIRDSVVAGWWTSSITGGENSRLCCIWGPG